MWPAYSNRSVPTICQIYLQTWVNSFFSCSEIGGEGQEIEPEISIERYDPAVNLWSFVLPVNRGKLAHAQCSWREKLRYWVEIMATIRFGNVKFMT